MSPKDPSPRERTWPTRESWHGASWVMRPRPEGESAPQRIARRVVQ